MRRLTILSTHVLAGFGLYYTITNDVPDDALVSAFSFLINMLNEEHRGFRLVTIDCCTYMVNSLSNFKSHKILYEHVNQTLLELLEKLKIQDQTLYRKKADLISLISQILPHYSEDKELQRTVIKCLLKMWRDPDSEVRHVSINMVQVLQPLIVAFRRIGSRRGVDSFPRPRRWCESGFTNRYHEGACSINQQRRFFRQG